MPGSMEPTRSKTPMLLAGTAVAAKIASPSGTPKEIALRIQSYRFVAEPAMVPLVSVALPSFTVTSWPPS